MQNMQIKMEGKILTIRIDTSQTHGVSSSGKSTIVATTAGNIEIESHPGLRLGLNCYRKIAPVVGP